MKGPGERTKNKTRRKNTMALQQSLDGGRTIKRARRRLIERQAEFDAIKGDKRGRKRPGSMKGAA
jgi:hypothetical protein